jgi:hypothetical protein
LFRETLLPESWDTEQFWLKAQVYMARAKEGPTEKWVRPFWSILALEFLARAALTNIHPALNADPKDMEHLIHAIGLESKGEPVSVPIHSVIIRLERLVPDFNKPTKDFCDFMFLVRNRELHSSLLPLESLHEKEWLPRFYKACIVLCKSLGFTLADLIGGDEAENAEKLVSAMESDIQGEVLKSIAAHKKVFEEKPQPDRDELIRQQLLVAQTWVGAECPGLCPACASLAKVQGELESVSRPRFDDGLLIVEHVYLATRMECGACALVLKDINEIHHAGVDPHFRRLVDTELHEWFEGDYYDEYNNM